MAVSETGLENSFGMKFYDRDKEINYLREIRRQAETSARFTVVTGRRRIGKTSLVLKAYEDEPMLYFFVARKAEADLCESFAEEIERVLNVPVMGRCKSFAEVFEFLMKVSVQRHFTLFIDEFQEFFKVNKSVFGDMQRAWDLYEKESRINLVVCGSVYSMMQKIFKDNKEPLYGRCTGELKVQPFRPSVLHQILADVKPDYTNEDLLALFSFTGGVAKYVQLLVDAKAFSKDEMIDAIVSENSLFLAEGRNNLVGEFGRDYGVYFSILTCISRGYNTRSAIEDVVGREIGGYLTNLEKDYELIRKAQPLFEKTSSKNVRYEIVDVFYTFWFRFLFKYNYIIEIENYAKMREIIFRDYETFSGLMLERFFYRKAIESGKCTRIGRWWDRKGFNEIDLICEDELEKKAEIYEIKRNASRIDYGVLKEKADVFLQTTAAFKDYEVTCLGLSMDDM